MVTKKLHPSVNNLLEEQDSELTMPHQLVWSEAQNLLRDLLNADIFNLWFAPLKAAALNDESITLEVANDFSELWIKDNYGGVIKDAVATAAGRPLKVNFKIASHVGSITPRSQSQTSKRNGEPAAAAEEESSERAVAVSSRDVR